MVEQHKYNVRQFGVDAIQNSDNLIRLDKDIHQLVSNHYSSRIIVNGVSYSRARDYVRSIRPTTCSQNVVTIFTCKFCQGSTIKFGKSQAGKTRYRCKNWLKTMLQDYTYKACEKEINFQIILLTKEGCGSNNSRP